MASGKSAELINYLSEWHARTVRLPDNLNALPKADAADDIEMIMASQTVAPVEAGQPAGTTAAPAGAASPVAPRRNQRREHRDNTAAPTAGNGEDVIDEAQAAQAELHQRVAKRARLAAKVAMEAETRDKLAANFAELRRELDLHRLDIMSYRDAKLQSQREIKRLLKEKRRLDEDYKLQYADYMQAAHTTQHTRETCERSIIELRELVAREYELTQDTSAQLEALKRIEQEMIARDMRNSELQLRVQHFEKRNQMLESILSSMPMFRMHVESGLPQEQLLQLQQAQAEWQEQLVLRQQQMMQQQQQQQAEVEAAQGAPSEQHIEQIEALKQESESIVVEQPAQAAQPNETADCAAAPMESNMEVSAPVDVAEPLATEHAPAEAPADNACVVENVELLAVSDGQVAAPTAAEISAHEQAVADAEGGDFVQRLVLLDYVRRHAEETESYQSQLRLACERFFETEELLRMRDLHIENLNQQVELHAKAIEERSAANEALEQHLNEQVSKNSVCALELQRAVDELALLEQALRAERARFTAVEQLIASSDARHANTERSLLETQIALATVERAMAECSQRYARGAEAVRAADKRANEACTQYDKANERAVAAERATAAALTAYQQMEARAVAAESAVAAFQAAAASSAKQNPAAVYSWTDADGSAAPLFNADGSPFVGDYLAAGSNAAVGAAFTPSSVYFPLDNTNSRRKQADVPPGFLPHDAALLRENQRLTRANRQSSVRLLHQQADCAQQIELSTQLLQHLARLVAAAASGKDGDAALAADAAALFVDEDEPMAVEEEAPVAAGRGRKAATAAPAAASARRLLSATSLKSLASALASAAAQASGLPEKEKEPEKVKPKEQEKEKVESEPSASEADSDDQGDDEDGQKGKRRSSGSARTAAARLASEAARAKLKRGAPGPAAGSGRGGARRRSTADADGSESESESDSEAKAQAPARRGGRVAAAAAPVVADKKKKESVLFDVLEVKDGQTLYSLFSEGARTFVRDEFAIAHSVPLPGVAPVSNKIAVAQQTIVQFRAFFEADGRVLARCRCFVRDEQIDGRGKDEGYGGKREVFQAVHTVDIPLTDVIRPCTMTFVQPPSIKIEEAERQTQGRDSFYCRLQYDFATKHFEFLPRKR